jgi:hypothetical protein
MLRLLANLAGVPLLLAPAYAATAQTVEKVLITHSSEIINAPSTQVVDYRTLREAAKELR